MQTAVHFSSDRGDWETPQDFFDALNKRWHFTLDVCASKHNAKCKRYYTVKQDALMQPWRGVCWMNPPYGRGIGQWIKKAFDSAQQGATVVCLIPSRTDTRWWHDYVMKGEVTFIRGRLRFVGAEASTPFPSAVVVFRK